MASIARGAPSQFEFRYGKAFKVELHTYILTINGYFTKLQEADDIDAAKKHQASKNLRSASVIGQQTSGNLVEFSPIAGVGKKAERSQSCRVSLFNMAHDFMVFLPVNSSQITGMTMSSWRVFENGCGQLTGFSSRFISRKLSKKSRTNGSRI